jgi:hypothetical protein
MARQSNHLLISLSPFAGLSSGSFRKAAGGTPCGFCPALFDRMLRFVRFIATTRLYPLAWLFALWLDPGWLAAWRGLHGGSPEQAASAANFSWRCNSLKLQPRFVGRRCPSISE